MALLKQEILVLVFFVFVCVNNLYKSELLSLWLLQYPYPTTPEHASQHKVVSGVEVEFPSNLSLSAVSILQGVCRFVFNVCCEGVNHSILATSRFTFYITGELKIVVY